MKLYMVLAGLEFTFMVYRVLDWISYIEMNVGNICSSSYIYILFIRDATLQRGFPDFPDFFSDKKKIKVKILGHFW